MPNQRKKDRGFSSAEFGRIRSYLARYRPDDVTAAEWNNRIRQAVGARAGAVDRGEVAERLKKLAEGHTEIAIEGEIIR